MFPTLKRFDKKKFKSLNKSYLRIWRELRSGLAEDGNGAYA